MADAYVEMVNDRISEGWEPVLLTFKFNQIPGSPETVASAMRKDIEGVYNLLLTRLIRNTRSEVGRTRCPLWITAADYPVPKNQKQLIRDVLPNDGRHQHTVALFHPTRRFREPVADHIFENLNRYLDRFPKLYYLHAEPITRTPEVVTRYVLKSLTRGRVSDEDVWILPRATSELR